MSYKLVLVFLITPLFQSVFGQSETYTVKKAYFSSDVYDEFSPVFYKKGIVFCSNRSPNFFSDYQNQQGKGLFKIYYSDTTYKEKSPSLKLFSKNLKTRFNDGPVAFNSKGDTIYFSRNLEVEGKFEDISLSRNKLGLFCAVFDGNEWTKIRALRINNEYYNVTTPSLASDGKKLFFASDKPGGFGGSDIYYSQYKGGFWSDPVNLGPLINTKGNESYPFVTFFGELFFSSDGHTGLGGKDIFFSRFSDSAWLAPVHINPPINSQYDDFGIVTDTLMNAGYFSSNRDKTIDIFHFVTNHPQVFYSTIQEENQYCFTFNDIASIIVDTTNLMYKWSFGNEESYKGVVIKHCFPGPGNYNVRLDIVERGTERLFFTKLINTIELRDIEQPYINSVNVAVKGNAVLFNGLKSNLPGYKILSYYWDFGDGNQSVGENVMHSFKEAGEYVVNLELILRSNSTGITRKTGISKSIIVFNDLQERVSYMYKIASQKTSSPDVTKYKNAVIKTKYSAEAESRKEAVFCVELRSTKSRIGIDSWAFRNVPKWYKVRERYSPDDSTYIYTVDQQMSLMATYPAYRELIGYGFKTAKIKMFVLKDPAEKELHNLIKIYSASADSYFDPSESLTSNAYIMLDQIVKLMEKNPAIKLEVAVHTDNTLSKENSQVLTQKRSQMLVSYLINRGVSAKRLIATGFGESKPIASNISEKDRKLNRRIEFIIIN
jgi:outer membrane protein OmpA-like peptidoglycan-associated protein